MITRRRFIAAGALVMAVPVPVPGKAGESFTGRPHDHGAIRTYAIEGSLATVALRAGDVATVLLHVARRWHYEIAAVDSGEGGGVFGYRAGQVVEAPFESAYLSGTAIAIHPAAYPLRGSERLWPHQELIVRDILADCAGTVRWGGDLTPVKASHFQIDVAPGSRKLARVAAELRTDRSAPAVPLAGAAVDPATPARRVRARALQRTQGG